MEQPEKEIKIEDFKGFGKDEISLFATQSETHLKESLTSFREANNKSYAAFTLYIASIAYCFTQITKAETTCLLPYVELLIGSAISTGIMFFNLFKGDLSIPGMRPSMAIQDYLHVSEEKLRDLTLMVVIANENGFIKNYKEIRKRTKRLETSIYAFTGSIIIFGLLFVICRYTCLCPL